MLTSDPDPLDRCLLTIGCAGDEDASGGSGASSFVALFALLSVTVGNNVGLESGRLR